MQRRRLIAASLSHRRPPPRPSLLPRPQPTPSPAARDGGRGASATANNNPFVNRKTARRNRAVFVLDGPKLARLTPTKCASDLVGERLGEVGQHTTIIGLRKYFGRHAGEQLDISQSLQLARRD